MFGPWNPAVFPHLRDCEMPLSPKKLCCLTGNNYFVENALKMEFVNCVLFGMAQFSTLGEASKGTQAYSKKKYCRKMSKKVKKTKQDSHLEK